MGEEEANDYLARQREFDPDLWIIEVEDKAGRHFLGDAGSGETDGRPPIAG